MRYVTVVLASMLVVSACTNAGSPETTTQTITTTMAPPTTVTPVSTATSQPTTTTVVEPSLLSVAYEIDGSLRLSSMRHIEVFFYPEDALDGDDFPVAVLVEDHESPLDGSVFFDESVSSGTYEVRSFQQICGESCSQLEPPSEGCATRLEVTPGSNVHVAVVDRPGTECRVVVDGAETSEPFRDMALTLQPAGGPSCNPPSPHDAASLTEALGTASGAVVGWGLLWVPPPIPVGLLTKMVFRVTGDGPTEIVAMHTDGTTRTPQWGPNEHGSGSVSSYGRPGTEWGLAIEFPKAGCWTVQFTIGDETIDFWLHVR